MFEKVNPTKVVSDHVSTLRTPDSERLKKGDVFLQFIFPGLISLVLVYFGIYIEKDIASPLATCLSIFCPLLLNLQVLIYGIIDKKTNGSQEDDKKREKVAKLLRETYYNISFGILASVVAVLFMFVFFVELASPVHVIVISWLQRNNLGNGHLEWFVGLFHLRSLLSFFGFYLVGIFLVDMFIVIKRVHILVDYEMKKD